MFVAILLLIAGTLNVIYGIAAIAASLGIFALCVICIHGLLVYGEEDRAMRT